MMTDPIAKGGEHVLRVASHHLDNEHVLEMDSIKNIPIAGSTTDRDH
jgi:hypothetical protein